MTLDLGDEAVARAAVSVSLPSDGAGSAGDFVTLNGSGQATPTSATDDDIVGVLANDSPSSAGDPSTVWIAGPVVANVASGIAAGDVLEGSTTAGQVAANANGYSHAVDEGGTATYRLSMGGPQALSAEGGSWPPQAGNSLAANAAVVML